MTHYAPRDHDPFTDTVEEVIIQGILPATDLIDTIITGGSSGTKRSDDE
ncbi:MAG: hypothetical protein KBD01_02730 [Acidobacteria bacterium]|nr:hypothetical protein [Acidobacteriota bacterium]